MASSPTSPTSPFSPLSPLTLLNSTTSDANTYPVVAHLWTTFQATLMVQAKVLVNDIAKHQGRDAKELWAQIKNQIRFPLVDIEFPEPTLCSFPIGSKGTAVLQRCRAPCVLGFGTCHEHASLSEESKPHNHSKADVETVDSIKDMSGNTYYLDTKGIARDKLGKTSGIVKDDVLYLFSKNS